MSIYSSNGSYGLSRPGSKSLVHKPLLRKKGNFRRDPVVVLTYVVLFGVLVSGLTSFGL